MNPKIHILASRKIDTDKWNRCISEHANGLIYSSKAYLDAMSENWHGMVINDYAAVMPLPWKKKFGIRYGYTPPFTQQLGITGDIDGIDLSKLLKKLYRFVSFADILFNFSNTAIHHLLPVVPRTNLVINLMQPLDSIRSAYKNDLKENIRKAETQMMLRYSGANDFDEAVNAYHFQYGTRMPHIKKKDYRHFLQLCHSLHKKEQAFTRAVTDVQGKLMAIAVFLKDGKRIYNLMNTTLPEGRNREANHLLLDRVITEFAEQPLFFDFEGSELPGVRDFYEKFGAVNQPYFHYHYNGYSWPLRLLKQ